MRVARGRDEKMHLVVYLAGELTNTRARKPRVGLGQTQYGLFGTSRENGGAGWHVRERKALSLVSDSCRPTSLGTVRIEKTESFPGAYLRSAPPAVESA